MVKRVFIEEILSVEYSSNNSSHLCDDIEAEADNYVCETINVNENEIHNNEIDLTSLPSFKEKFKLATGYGSFTVKAKVSH